MKTGTLTTCRIPIKSLRLAARTVTPATYDRQFDCPSSQSINLNQFVKNNRPAAANHPGPSRGASRTAISMVSTFETINPGETLEQANFAIDDVCRFVCRVTAESIASSAPSACDPRNITFPDLRYDWYCFDTANVTACACPMGPDGTAEQCQQVTGRQIPMNEQHKVHRLRPNRVGRQSTARGIIKVTRSATQGG